jgi:hypothetical protein
MHNSHLKRFSIFLTLSLLLGLTANVSYARKQWTEKQAWAWQKRVGTIKGFNQMELPYPGMPQEQVLQAAHNIGLNSLRLWIPGGNAKDQIANLRKVVELCKKYDMTVSPVLCVPVLEEFFSSNGTDAKALKVMENYTKEMVGAFAKEKRVILWDLWNEPGWSDGFNPSKDMDRFILHLRAIAKITEWAREMNPVQALSSSIFWRPDILNRDANPTSKLCWEVEGMMDVHNFHNYACSDDHKGYIQWMINVLKKISNRPLVCTECLTRPNNSGLARTFATFEKENTNFYLWGLYMNDANWSIRWSRSAYNPYESPFHDLLRPDGTPIDARDIELIRNFKFTNGKDSDPGAEMTDQWEHERTWRWMSIGPVKGKTFASAQEATEQMEAAKNAGFNSLNVKFSYNLYKENEEEFFKQIDKLLDEAGKAGITIMPSLLNDSEVSIAADKDLVTYEQAIVNRYYNDGRIQAWDLYFHPGKELNDTQRITELIRQLFREMRYVYPNQPLTATPWVRSKNFPQDFDPQKAMVHGNRNGWNWLEYGGGANADLCYLIWKLSDLVSFSSDQSAAQTGWLKALAFRYGKPVFCTRWKPTDQKNADETLDNFSRSHIYWYQEEGTAHIDASAFHFKPICTPH